MANRAIENLEVELEEAVSSALLAGLDEMTIKKVFEMTLMSHR